MSPSEDDLRSALSNGADAAGGAGGGAPDVDRIVFAAKEHRAQRTKRMLSAAAAVIVVGGVATGGTLLARSGGDGTAGGGGTRADVQGNSPTGYGVAAGTTDGPMISATACPSHVPNTLLPGGGGTTQFGSAGALFAQPVESVTVCAYSSVASSSAPVRVELTGSDATTFAASLENAPRIRPREACPDYRAQDQKSLAIVATTTAAGKPLPTVTTTLDEPTCAVQVTNGTAVRYAWSWPTSLRSKLAELNAAAPSIPPSSGTRGLPTSPASFVPPSDRINGSPAR